MLDAQEWGKLGPQFKSLPEKLLVENKKLSPLRIKEKHRTKKTFRVNLAYL